MIGKKINQLATELAPASTDLTIIGNPTTGVSKKITLAQLGAIFSGAVSFYTNYASFPATGTTDVIFCAKDTQKLYLWNGSAYVEVFPSQALLDTYQLRSEKGNANGYASLDSQGKVPISQLPSSIMEYKGTWSAATNTPTLANGTGDTGDVYICNAAGSVNFGAGAISFAVGDYVIYSGTIWQRSSGAVGTVTSVAASITGDSVTISGSPVTTSGTLAFAFAGTGTQYIKGDGTLATFPSIISQAQNLVTEVYNSTGATLTKGTIVYINGGQGNLPTVTKAIATGDSTSAQTYGIVQADITNMNNGYVVVAGRLSDLDTQAYTEGTQLYLSSTTAGAYTSTKQYAPAHLVYVGIIVRSHPTQGIIEVKIQNGYELDELHNVAAQTPSNNDGLFYESSTSLWKNKSLSTILGGTPVTGSGNVNTIPKFTANSVLGNSNIEDDGNFVSMRGLKINAVSGVGNTINFEQGTGVNAAGIGYSTIGAASTTGFVFYIDQNTTSRSFVLDTTTITSATQLTYSLPASNGTLALVSQLTGGTVTSVGLSVPTGFSVSGSPVTSSGTLALAFDTGYSLPTIAKQNNWDTAYNTRIVTASSPLSFISNTISISQASGSTSGYLSSTDWTTFNNKQNALTNPVTGTGTTNYLPKFTGTSTIGNSIVQDASTYIDVAGYAFLRRGSKYLLLNPNYAGATVYADISAEAGMGLSLSANGVTKQLYIDTSGNLGLGVTPSAWSIGTALEIANGAAILGFNNETFIANNAYYNGGWKYRATAAAQAYFMNGGEHKWQIAPSGTAGNAISFTQAMTLNASGNLSLGNTNNTYKLDVTGPDGSVGTIRWANAGGRKSGFLYSDSAGVAIYDTNLNDAGIYLAGNTQMDFRVNGSQRMLINSSGNVGIGTTSPQDKLEVVGATFIRNGNAGVRIGGDATYGWISAYTYNLGATAPLVLQTNGANVGIGTTSPTHQLHVVNSVKFDTGLYFNNSGTGGAFVWQIANESLRFGTNDTERMRITSGGNVGIGTTSPGYNLDVSSNVNSENTIRSINLNSGAAATARIYVENNIGSLGQFTTYSSGFGFTVFGLYAGNYTALLSSGTSSAGLLVGSLTSAPVIFGTDNTERMRITSGGLVQINHTNTAKGNLDVASDVNAVPLVIRGRSADGEGQVEFWNYAGSTRYGVLGSTSNYSYFGSIANTPLYFLTNSTERMRITSGGNVNINGTQTSDRFSVQGSNNGTSIGLQGAGLVRTYYATASTGTTYDAFRFLTESGSVYKSGGICGYLYMNFQDSGTGANQKSYVYSIMTTGNGTSPGPYNFDLVSTGSTRGNNPVSSITLVNDGTTGCVKVQVTSASSGISGIIGWVTFVGTAL